MRERIPKTPYFDSWETTRRYKRHKAIPEGWTWDKTEALPPVAKWKTAQHAEYKMYCWWAFRAEAVLGEYTEAFRYLLKYGGLF